MNEDPINEREPNKMSENPLNEGEETQPLKFAIHQVGKRRDACDGTSHALTFA